MADRHRAEGEPGGGLRPRLARGRGRKRGGLELSRPDAPTGRPSTRPPPIPTAIFLGVCGASLLFYVALTRSPDLALAYPFMGGDSWDWIANGLAIAGHEVRYSGRSPLVPLLLAALERLGALEAFPAIQLTFFHLGCAGLGLLLARFYPWWAAYAAAVVLLVNHLAVGLALLVMADVLAAGLLFAALVPVALARERPRLYLVAGALGGLSYLTQELALLLPLPVALLIATRRREHLRSGWLWAGAAVFALGPIAWALVKYAVFGAFGDTRVGHWSLFRPSPGGALYYGWAALSAAGAPALALALAGAVSAPRRREEGARGDLLLLSLVLAAAVMLFFGLLYTFHDKRFLIYAAPPAAVLVAEGLSRLRRRWAIAAAAAAAVLWSHAPAPGPWTYAGMVTLWPVPPVQLDAPEERPSTLRSRLRFAEAEVEARPAAAFVAHGNPARAWRARREIDRGGSARPAVASRDFPPAGVRGVLYLHRPGVEPERYRTLTRLGSVLRLPAHFLPRGFLEPCLERWAPAEPVGGVGGWDLYELSPAALDGTWWLATAAGEPPPGLSASRGGSAPSGVAEGAASSPAAAGDAAAVGEALRLRRYIEGSDTVIAVVAPPGTGCAPVVYLPFLAGTGDVFVLPVEPGDEPVQVREAPVLDELRTGRSRAVRTRLGGLPSAIVVDLGASGPPEKDAGEPSGDGEAPGGTAPGAGD